MTPSLISSSRRRSPRFDKIAYNQFKLSSRFGEAISGWDHPQMVKATEAIHMRDDDYVVGFVFRGHARAYPVWVVDNYHVVNDQVDGERVLLVSCERCQSGAAFLPSVEGNPEREPLFRSVGFLNATLVLKDLRTGGHWLHYDGLGLDRRSEGTRLPWIPTYHMEWADWVALHPDTDVMVPPEDPRHPDARHGHGREEIFARAGMDPSFIPTVVGDLDETYPENEMILGITTGPWDEAESVAYPLHEVHRERGVVEDVLGERRVVVFAGPRPDGFTMAAFVPSAAGRKLTFVRTDGAFRDHETGSTWSIEGVAMEGPLAGVSLEPVRSSYVRWHAWIYFHRGTRIFRSRVEPDPYHVGVLGTLTEEFETVLSSLAQAGHEVRIGGPLVTQRRPRRSRSSIVAYVDGHRVILHAFDSENGARDLHEFDAAWSGLPVKPRSHEGRTQRIGRIVIESDPEMRFADPANVVPLPPSAVAWAPVLDSEVLNDLAKQTSTPRGDGDVNGFVEIVRGLRLSGHEVIDIGFLPPSQLRVGVLDGIALTIDSDRFLLYRFSNSETATRYAYEQEYSLAVGSFVIRSTPDTMYRHQASEILYAGDHTIRWSPLLDDPRFVRALQGVIVEPSREMSDVIVVE